MKPVSEQSNFAVLLLCCADRRGIVAEISGWIARHNGNITESDQYHAHDVEQFFSRIAWDMSDFDLSEQETKVGVAELAGRFAMRWQLHFTRTPLRTAIMVSRYDHCLYDLLVRERAGELDTQIKLVLSNHRDLAMVAEHFSVPFYHFPMEHEGKQEQEKRQLALLRQEGIDLLVLARYMQILSPWLVQAFPERIINVHHSFLPAFVGAKPYHQAYERGVKIIGATSHYVTQELDQGPIIAQSVVQINHRDTVKDLVAKGRNLEKQVLADAVRMHLQFRILTFGNKTVVFS